MAKGREFETAATKDFSAIHENTPEGASNVLIVLDTKEPKVKSPWIDEVTKELGGYGLTVKIEERNFEAKLINDSEMPLSPVVIIGQWISSDSLSRYIKALKTKSSETFIVVTSIAPTSQDAIEVFRAGADDFLRQRMYKYEEVINTIQFANTKLKYNKDLLGSRLK